MFDALYYILCTPLSRLLGCECLIVTLLWMKFSELFPFRFLVPLFNVKETSSFPMLFCWKYEYVSFPFQRAQLISYKSCPAQVLCFFLWQIELQLTEGSPDSGSAGHWNARHQSAGRLILHVTANDVTPSFAGSFFFWTLDFPNASSAKPQCLLLQNVKREKGYSNFEHLLKPFSNTSSIWSK